MHGTWKITTVHNVKSKRASFYAVFCARDKFALWGGIDCILLALGSSRYGLSRSGRAEAKDCFSGPHVITTLHPLPPMPNLVAPFAHVLALFLWLSESWADPSSFIFQRPLPCL
jgi:hypothetical protein